MRQNPPCPDCGRPQIQLALFDPDLSLYCEACNAELLGEFDRNYPEGEEHQEFENGDLERDDSGGAGRDHRPRPKTKPL